MTPKEKAEELVIKYLRLNGDTEWFHKVLAKQCALIAVDEIIDTIECTLIAIYEIYEVPNMQLTFWFKVKQEIEEL